MDSDLLEVDSKLMSALVQYLDYTGELINITNTLKQEFKSNTSSELSRSSAYSLNDSFSSVGSGSSIFPEGNRQLLRVQVKINVILLAEFDVDLAEMIMMDKKNFIELFQYVTFKFLTNVMYKISKQSQILVTPIITGLAPLYDHEVRDRSELSLIRSSCLMSAKVTVVGLAMSVKYVSSTSYHCTSHDCEDFRDETEYVKMFSAVGGSEEYYQCIRCDGKLEEQYKRRDVREVVPGLVRIHGRGEEDSSRVVSAVFRQEDEAKLKEQLGQRTTIVFTVETTRSGDLILEVNSAELFFPDPVRPSVDSKILQLLNNRQASAWSFVSSLAYVFCEHLVPPGTFMQLRLALLLSLVSGPEDRLNVLAVGDEDLMLSSVMLEGAETAGGQVYTSNISLSGSVSKGRLSFLECGQFHHSRNSVLYLGDVLSLKQNVREALVKSVEAQAVTSPTPLVVSQPLSTALWALASTSSVKPKRADNSRLLTVLESIKDFSSSMDFLVQTSDTSEECGETLASFSLEASREPNKISMEEISGYLNYVKKVAVTIPENCKEFLQQYFLSSRRVRPYFPQSTIRTLMKTAVAHARLASRKEVYREDCVFACHFIEDMMTNLTGYSYLGHDIKSPVVGDTSLDTLLGAGHETEMRDFQFRLEKFIFDSFESENPGSGHLSTEE